MRRASVRLLALIAVLPALFLLSPPRASYACTAVYPDKYVETHTIDMPALPENISVYTTPAEIVAVVDDKSISPFSFDKGPALRANKDRIPDGLLAIVNHSDETIYVLGKRADSLYTPDANDTKILPDGLSPLFSIHPNEGLEISPWKGTIGYIAPNQDPYNFPDQNIVNEMHVMLYAGGEIIDIKVTYQYDYNEGYLATKTAIDRGMAECHAHMTGDWTIALFNYPDLYFTRGPGFPVLILAAIVNVAVIGAFIRRLRGKASRRTQPPSEPTSSS